MPPTDRLTLDGGARNSFWQTVALGFNNPDNTYEPHTSMHDSDLTAKFVEEGLSPEYNGYVATAAKVEEEFKSMRTDYVHAMAKFRQSGMGDMGPDVNALEYEAKVKLSNTVYSSKFKDFTNKNLVIAYMYELFLIYDLLASAGCDMPEGTSHSSDTTHHNARGEDPLQPQPRKGANNKRGRGGELEKSLVEVLSQSRPVVDPAAARARHWRGELLRQRTSSERREQVRKCIDEFEANCGRLAGEVHSAFRAILERRQAALLADMEELQTPMQEPPAVAVAPAAASAQSSVPASF